MVEEFQGKIDTHQSQIQSLESKSEKQEETEALNKKLKEHHATFMGSVDGAQQEVTKGLSALKDKNNQQVISGYAQEIQDYLGIVVQKGEAAYKSQMDKKAAGDLPSIDTYAVGVNERIAEINNALPFLKELEKADTQWTEKGLPAAKEVDTLLDDKKLGPVERRDALVKGADKAIDEIAKAKQIMKNTRSIPDSLMDVYRITVEEYDKKLEEMGDIKVYYEVRDFAASEKYSQYLTFDEETGEVKKTEAFDKLEDDEKQRILLELASIKKKIADEIDEKCAVSEQEKSFFEAKRQLGSGDWISAKGAFLKYVKEESDFTDESFEDHQAEAKEYLKQIGLLELAQAQQRLNLMRASIEAQFAQLGTGDLPVGTNHTMANLFMGDMDKVLAEGQKLIESGKALTIEEVHKQLTNRTDPTGPFSRLKMGFQTGMGDTAKYNLVFDVLRTQAEMNNEKDPEKRRQNALKMAKDARELGLPDLARHYYDIYFQKDIEKQAKKVSREEIAKGVRSDSAIHEQVDAQMEALIEATQQEYKKKHSEELSYEEAKEMVAPQRNQFYELAIDKAYAKAVKTEVHKSFQGETSEEANAWNEAYGNTFVNLDTYGAKWYQFWKFSDAEWNEFKTLIWVDIAAMIAGAGIGGKLAGGAVRGSITRALIKQGISKTAIEVARSKGPGYFARFVTKELGIKQAIKYGATSFVIESGVTHVVNGTISGIPRGDFSMYESPEKFFKGWGKMALMMGAGKVTNFGFSFRKPPPGIVQKAMEGVAMTVGDEAIMTGFEISLMAMQGEEITEEKIQKIVKDNVVFAVGLRIGGRIAHGPRGEKTGKPEEPTEKTAVKETSKGAEGPKPKPTTEPSKVPVDFSNPPRGPSDTVPIDDYKPTKADELKVNDTVELRDPMGGGERDKFIIESVAPDGKISLRMLKDGKITDVKRIIASMEALKGEIHKTKIETGENKQTPGEKLMSDLSSGKVEFNFNEQAPILKEVMNPQDYSVLEANHQTLSPQMRQAVLVGGETLSFGGGKTIRAFRGRHLGEGAYGTVAEVSYVEAGSTTLKTGVIKKPHGRPDAITNFGFEAANAIDIHRCFAEHPDAGAAHVIKPVFASADVIIYEKITDATGKTENLQNSISSMSDKEWLQQFAGGVEGLAYLHRNGIVHNDFKPGNIVMGQKGGVLIDIGSTVRAADVGGKVQLRTTAEGVTQTHYIDAQGNGHWVAMDPMYNNSHLLATSIAYKKPLDIGDKFAVGRSVQFMLASKGYIDNNTGALLPNAPPHAQQLHAISARLLAANNHPYAYKNNNPAEGADPNYVSLDQANTWIRGIASTLP